MCILMQQSFVMRRNKITSWKGVTSTLQIQKSESYWEQVAADALNVNGIVMKRWVTNGDEDNSSIV